MKLYEVNTLFKDGEIATSETFTDYSQARKYYDGIGDDTMKILSLVSKHGSIIREIESNFKQ